MLEFHLNSDYGFVRVGRLTFSWLNKFSHWERWRDQRLLDRW